MFLSTFHLKYSSVLSRCCLASQLYNDLDLDFKFEFSLSPLKAASQAGQASQAACLASLLGKLAWQARRLAKQETLTPPGHLVSPLVCRGP